LSVGIGAIKLSDGLLSVFFLLVGHVGCSLRSSGAVISQLKSNNRANSAEELIEVILGEVIVDVVDSQF